MIVPGRGLAKIIISITPINPDPLYGGMIRITYNDMKTKTASEIHCYNRVVTLSPGDSTLGSRF